MKLASGTTALFVLLCSLAFAQTGPHRKIFASVATPTFVNQSQNLIPFGSYTGTITATYSATSGNRLFAFCAGSAFGVDFSSVTMTPSDGQGNSWSTVGSTSNVTSG